ncbi:MAG: TetR/AcrR family transcriptional regulator [Ilumatobacteraceae bacterium]
MTGIHERRRALTKGERTRERLLRAAMDRFGSHGFRATSVSQLSRDAGLTPAAAYAYFADKETFWNAAVVADLDALQSEIGASAARSERPVVDSMFSIIHGLQQHPLARRVMVEGSPADLQLVLSHPLFTRTTHLLEVGLAARKASGILPESVNPQQLALGMETVIFALVLSVVRAGMHGAPDRVDAVVALLANAAGGLPTPDERRLGALP